MSDLPSDPFNDFAEVAHQLWTYYTAAIAALMEQGFTEDQARQLAFAAVMSSVS